LSPPKDFEKVVPRGAAGVPSSLGGCRAEPLGQPPSKGSKSAGHNERSRHPMLMLAPLRQRRGQENAIAVLM
jgi:hypothetical protein